MALEGEGEKLWSKDGMRIHVRRNASSRLVLYGERSRGGEEKEYHVDGELVRNVNNASNNSKTLEDRIEKGGEGPNALVRIDVVGLVAIGVTPVLNLTTAKTGGVSRDDSRMKGETFPKAEQEALRAAVALLQLR